MTGAKVWFSVLLRLLFTTYAQIGLILFVFAKIMTIFHHSTKRLMHLSHLVRSF